MIINPTSAKYSYEVVEGDTGVVSVVRGNPSDGYDVLVVSTEAISHHERKYEAKAAARGRGEQ